MLYTRGKLIVVDADDIVLRVGWLLALAAEAVHSEGYCEDEEQTAST